MIKSEDKMGESFEECMHVVGRKTWRETRTYKCKGGLDCTC